MRWSGKSQVPNPLLKNTESNLKYNIEGYKKDVLTSVTIASYNTCPFSIRFMFLCTLPIHSENGVIITGFWNTTTKHSLLSTASVTPILASNQFLHSPLLFHFQRQVVLTALDCKLTTTSLPKKNFTNSLAVPFQKHPTTFSPSLPMLLAPPHISIKTICIPSGTSMYKCITINIIEWTSNPTSLPSSQQ